MRENVGFLEDYHLTAWVKHRARGVDLEVQRRLRTYLRQPARIQREESFGSESDIRPTENGRFDPRLSGIAN